MNGADIIVLTGVGAVVLLAAAILWRKKRSGRGGCGCGCSGCGSPCKKNREE